MSICESSVTRNWNKSSPIVSWVAQKITWTVFTQKVMFSKYPKHLGYLWKIICRQELSKIPKSGHTVCDRYKARANSLLTTFFRGN